MGLQPLLVVDGSGVPTSVVPGGAILPTVGAFLGGAALKKLFGGRGKGIMIPGAGVCPFSAGTGLKDRIKRAIQKATKIGLPLLKKFLPQMGREFLGSWRGGTGGMMPIPGMGGMAGMGGMGGMAGMGAMPPMATIQPYPFPYQPRKKGRKGGAVGFGTFDRADQWGVYANDPITAVSEKNLSQMPIMYGDLG